MRPPQIVATSCRLATAIASSGGLVVLVRVDFGAGLAARRPRAQPMCRWPSRPAGCRPTGPRFSPNSSRPRRTSLSPSGTGAHSTGPSLDLELRRRGITHIVVGGIATNFGVESTARDGWQGNYTVIVAEDAASSFRDEMQRICDQEHLAALLPGAKSDEIIAALSKARAAVAVSPCQLKLLEAMQRLLDLPAARRRARPLAIQVHFCTSSLPRSRSVLRSSTATMSSPISTG